MGLIKEAKPMPSHAISLLGTGDDANDVRSPVFAIEE